MWPNRAHSAQLTNHENGHRLGPRPEARPRRRGQGTERESASGSYPTKQASYQIQVRLVVSRKSNSARERQQASERSVPTVRVTLPRAWVLSCSLSGFPTIRISTAFNLLFISPSCLTCLISFYPIFSFLYPSHWVAAAPPNCYEPYTTGTASSA